DAGIVLIPLILEEDVPVADPRRLDLMNPVGAVEDPELARFAVGMNADHARRNAGPGEADLVPAGRGDAERRDGRDRPAVVALDDERLGDATRVDVERQPGRPDFIGAAEIVPLRHTPAGDLGLRRG